MVPALDNRGADKFRVGSGFSQIMYMQNVEHEKSECRLVGDVAHTNHLFALSRSVERDGAAFFVTSFLPSGAFIPSMYGRIIHGSGKVVATRKMRVT